eukprot:GHVU01154345.1.p2 GENE.GHVU01154345.1~~GHVU01154345.1.p2  ORF type:complete len:190 (+),score=12.54 GHVU01154345.1:407-976(+)
MTYSLPTSPLRLPSTFPVSCERCEAPVAPAYVGGQRYSAAARSPSGALELPTTYSVTQSTTQSVVHSLMSSDFSYFSPSPPSPSSPSPPSPLLPAPTSPRPPLLFHILLDDAIDCPLRLLLLRVRRIGFVVRHVQRLIYIVYSRIDSPATVQRKRCTRRITDDMRDEAGGQEATGETTNPPTLPPTDIL